MLRRSLLAYDEEGTAAAASVAAGVPQAPSPVVPQVDNTFLERLVTLSNKSQDFEFRQTLVNEMQRESLKIVPLQGEEQYYRNLLDALNRRGGQQTAGPEETAQIRQQILGIFDEAIETTNQVNEIYYALSQNLNPSTVLYSTTAPPVTRHESSAASGSQLMLIFALLLLLTLPLSIIVSFLHYRFTNDVAEASEEERATTQPEPRVAVPGGRATGV
jgi:hypothetical protein